ncbi:hypothetical protein [Pectobacterium sp. B2J-2]
MWQCFAISNIYTEPQRPDAIRTEFQQFMAQKDYSNPPLALQQAKVGI